MGRSQGKNTWALPEVTAEVTFLTTEEGGRKTPPAFQAYWPHIVVQSPDVRHAAGKTASGLRMFSEETLGIHVLDGPKKCVFGQSIQVVFELFYHPRVDYSAVIPGATFTIREGGRIVGFGRVLQRRDPPAGA